jgi:hypothetical protein
MSQKVENLTEETLKKAFKRLKKNTRNFSSLLVRDPLDYLDFEVNLYSNLSSIINEINGNNYHPQKPYLHLSAKSKGINRPTVVFDVKDALIYRFCIEQIEDELIKKTRQMHVRGGIKITPNERGNGDDFYEKWIIDWKEYQNDLKKSLQNKKYLVSTDIASYFENINTIVLNNLVRSDVAGKKVILNLLFYFLENTRFRFDYEVNTFNGLPQEDIDCSRILAYYFLNPNDNAMAEFCKVNDAEFYRFVDDMSITVNSEVAGKKALKTMTESLRKLNLVSSIEKTSIIDSAQAKSELFFQENDDLSKIEEGILAKLGKNQSVEPEIEILKKFYLELVKAKKDEYKNWIKILRRFYTLFTYTKSDFLLKMLHDHIVKYPDLIKVDKIGKYLIRNQNEDSFEKALIKIIDYLYSEENLYPAIESNLLEIFLLINPDNLSIEIKNKLKILCNDIFFKSSYQPLSDYARALSCLMFYRFDKSNIKEIANHYLKNSEEDYLLKKYIVFVCLTISNDSLRKKVLNRAKSEQSLSMNRLINLVENIDNYKNFNTVKIFLKREQLYIYKNKIVEDYSPIRVDILKDLINIYSD